MPLETGLVPQMKYGSYFITIVLLTVCTFQLYSEDTIKAYTEDGKGVLLHEDGTWTFSGKIGFFDVERNGTTSVDEISIENLLPCTITEVIDGDTLKVAFVDPPPGIRTEESVRLLGIDTPELKTSAEPDAFALEAREFVISYIADSTVYLAFESRWRGSFGRLLAYVFTSEGSLLNTELLSRGFASVYNDTPCYFHQYFVAIEVVARSESQGMWTTPMTGNIIIRQVYNEGRAEYVELWNRSAQTINISDWYLLDNQQNRIEIPLDTSISGNERLLVVSGAGPPPSSNYVQTTKASIWNNAGDTAKLYDRDGELVAEYGY